MGSESRALCTICARGGSKGVPNKNLRSLAGLPLIAYSIRQARATGCFEKVAVSSDSVEILRVAKDFGADVLIERPSDLASDSAAKIPAIRHCVETAEGALGTKFETVVDLDATSPLRLPADILGALKLFEEKSAEIVITGMPSRRSPYFNLVELDASGVARLSKRPSSSVVRRQDAPPCYDMNASIYVWSRSFLFGSDSVFSERTFLYPMPEERSFDIDTPLDFEIVEFLLTRKGSSIEID